MNPVDVFWDRCEGGIVFGRNDCCVTVADVIMAAGGPDLMAPYRGRYTTRLGYVRAFRKAGYWDFAEALRAAFSTHGCQVDVPDNFDVAIVSHLRDGEPVTSPAFFHSGFWHTRTEAGGLVSQSQGEAKIWRVIHA